MLGTLRRYKSDKADISQRLYNAIYEKVTRKTHKYESPQEGDGTITKCIWFFKDGADPEVLSELAESLSKQIELEKLPKKKEEYQRYYKYYIKTFLPALKTEVMLSLEPFKLSAFNEEPEHPQGIRTMRGKILKIISGITNRENGKSHPTDNAAQGQCSENSETNSKKDLEKLVETLELRNNLGSRADPSLLNKKKTPLSSPVSGSMDSISTSLTSFGGDGDLQMEEIEDRTQSEQLTKKERNTQENKNSGGQANPIVSGDLQEENEDQPPLQKQNPGEKPKKRENQKLEPTKQPNNRNFRIALATGCALSAIGCFLAGVVTLGMIGAGLLVISVVFTIAAVVTQHLTPPSSKLTYTDLSPLIDDSKQPQKLNICYS